MQRESTPIEARGGDVSSRAILVLLSSSVGAIVGRGLCWAFCLSR